LGPSSKEKSTINGIKDGFERMFPKKLSLTLCHISFCFPFSCPLNDRYAFNVHSGQDKRQLQRFAVAIKSSFSQLEKKLWSHLLREWGVRIQTIHRAPQKLITMASNAWDPDFNKSSSDSLEDHTWAIVIHEQMDNYFPQES
jgi:hypothetical protein